MYFVPDGTKRCGFYECSVCGDRFLSLHTEPKIVCPTCEKEMDPEIGPDDELTLNVETAKLLQIVEGEEQVEMMDKLLSLALTGGDYEWL